MRGDQTKRQTEIPPPKSDIDDIGEWYGKKKRVGHGKAVIHISIPCQIGVNWRSYYKARIEDSFRWRRIGIIGKPQIVVRASTFFGTNTAAINAAVQLNTPETNISIGRMSLDVTHNGIGNGATDEEYRIAPNGHLEPLLSQFGNINTLIGMLMLVADHLNLNNMGRNVKICSSISRQVGISLS